MHYLTTGAERRGHRDPRAADPNRQIPDPLGISLDPGHRLGAGVEIEHDLPGHVAVADQVAADGHLAAAVRGDERGIEARGDRSVADGRAAAPHAGARPSGRRTGSEGPEQLEVAWASLGAMEALGAPDESRSHRLKLASAAPIDRMEGEGDVAGLVRDLVGVLSS